MFWDNFLVQCAKRGKSPAVVADELGFSNSATTYWKNGSLPRMSSRKKIADYFGITVEELMGEKKQPAENGELDKQMQTRLLAAFDQLNEEGQVKVAGYAEDLCRTGYYKKHSENLAGAGGA